MNEKIDKILAKDSINENDIIEIHQAVTAAMENSIRWTIRLGGILDQHINKVGKEETFRWAKNNMGFDKGTVKAYIDAYYRRNNMNEITFKLNNPVY